MVHFDDGGEHEQLAPVTPLFGDASVPGGRVAREAGVSRPAHPATSWHSTWADEHEDFYDEDDDPTTDELADTMHAASDRLLKRLRRRGLSLAEATESLVTDGVDRVVAELYVAELERKRWLGDADLAEQLVHTAVTRKGEGRRAIAQTLAKRRIPRDIADAALAQLPDDDAERALEFARSKAGSMRSLDRETAVRRLSGQLARRGYGGSVAFTAARTALDELRVQHPSGVRFD